MKFTNNVIALVMAALVLTGVAIPSLHVSAFNDLNGDADVPLGYLSGDDLDGLSLRADVSGGHAYITSDLWRGPVMRNAIIVHTDMGSVYTDGSALFSLFGNTVRTYPTSVTVTIDGGSITVGDITVPIAYAYWPDTEGFYGSYVNATLTDPIGSVGRFAGITVGGSDSQVINNSSGYALDVSVTEDGDRYGIEYVPGNVDVPDVDPFLPDIEHEEDPEPVEPVEPGEYISSGTTGTCTWELDGDVLYIRGEGGTTANYSESQQIIPPWPKTIKEVIVEEGVVGIGNSLCGSNSRSAGWRELTYVSLPSTLKSIGNYAFSYTVLDSIRLPDGLTSLGTNVFRGTNISELIIPDGVEAFQQNVIQYCPYLRHLYIPETATVSSQSGFTFYGLDGESMGNIPTSGDLYLGTVSYKMYQTVTAEVDGATYHINYLGAELEQSKNIEAVHIPYSVTYDGTDYTVESVAHGAISGSAVKYVVIPQTIESMSHTAITAPSVREILNLSETEVTSASGRVSTEIASIATVAEKAVDDSYNTYALLIGAVVIICLVGMAVKLLPTRRGDWE